MKRLAILFVFISILLCSCGTKEKKYFMTEDSIKIFTDNKQAFYNVQAAFKVEDIKDDLLGLTRDNYTQYNLSNQQINSIEEIFRIPEIEGISFIMFTDTYRKDEKLSGIKGYELTFFMHKKGYEGDMTIVFNPPNDIRKSPSITQIDTEWYVENSLPDKALD